VRSFQLLQTLYHHLFEAFGPQHWWPGDSPFEIAVGAILTQNTNWTNVQRAIAQLKHAGVLSCKKMLALSDTDLADLIRPAGYFNVKTKRLKAFLHYLDTRHQASMARMKTHDCSRLRTELLTVHGIGPETADSILLYALEKPSFVIDVYTRRVLSRHSILPYEKEYHVFQAFFHENLPADVQMYNEFHALFVRVGKEYCKPTPKCSQCPLSEEKMQAV
jgi:endonuclease-3 related protein